MSPRPFVHTEPAYPVRRPEAIAAVVRQLESGDWTRLEGCPELEADLEARHGPDPAGRDPLVWFVASGTAALEAILLGHGIGPGDEVITTPYTWAATVSAVLAVGAIPVFADVDPVSGLLDPAGIPTLITARTRAILAVHLFGQPVACAALRRLADEAGILFLEDASQAHGARWDGRQVGDWGHAAAFSCMGLKPLAGTEGGYAIFRDRAAAEAAWLYGRHPRGLDASQVDRLRGLLDALQLGWRPSAVSGVLLRHALPHLDTENDARRANAAHLRAPLDGVPGVTLPAEADAARGVHHLASPFLAEGIDKTGLITALQAAGVNAFDYIPTPIHRLPRMNPAGYDGPRVFWHEQLRRAGVDYSAVRLPGAEERCRRSFEMSFNWTIEDPAAMRDLAITIADCIAQATP